MVTVGKIDKNIKNNAKEEKLIFINEILLDGIFKDGVECMGFI